MALSQIPAPSAPLVNPETGHITVPWFQFFLRLIARLLPNGGPAPADAGVVVTAPEALLPAARVATDSPTVAVDLSVPGIIRWHVVGGIPGAPSLISAPGAYALTGSAATLLAASPPLPTDVGTYALTGSAATVAQASVPVSTTAGAYALTGSDATVQWTVPPVFTFVSRAQNTVAFAFATSAGTAPQAHTAGNLLIVMVNENQNVAVTVSDLAGNVFTPIGTGAGYADAFGNRLRLWYASNILGHASNVVTATLSGTFYLAVSVCEFAGFGASAPVVADYDAGSSSAATLTTPTLTIPAAPTLLYSAQQGSAQGHVAGAGYVLHAFAASGDGAYYSDQWKYDADGGDQAITATQASSNAFVIFGVALKKP